MPTSRSRTGSLGENTARKYLEAQGYRILDTNYRCRWGEIDIVAQTDDTLVFVEVRTRKHLSYGTPQESLSKGKMARLTATAETYLQERQPETTHWRIDLVAVFLAKNGDVSDVQHIPNAIEQGYSIRED